MRRRSRLTGIGHRNRQQDGTHGQKELARRSQPPTDPSAKRLQDLAGNTVRDIWPNSVALENLTALPSVGHATVKGDRLTLTFDDPMDEGSVPAGSAFTVKVGTSDVSLASTSPAVPPSR